MPAENSIASRTKFPADCTVSAYRWSTRFRIGSIWKSGATAKSGSSPTKREFPRRCLDFLDDQLQLRHAFAAPARAGLPQQRPDDHARRRAFQQEDRISLYG